MIVIHSGFRELFVHACGLYLERNGNTRLAVEWARLFEGLTNAPRFFFNLRFGQRFLPDEEGIELRNRTAARDEALAVVSELANSKIDGNRQRWAGWFLEVADKSGGFFRTHLGHPALELVTSDRHAPGGAEPKLRPIPAEDAHPEEAHAEERTAEITQQREALHQRRAQLMKENHQLRNELLSLRLVTDAFLLRTQRVVSLARGASGGLSTEPIGAFPSPVRLI